MKKDRYVEGRFSQSAHGLGTITEEMIYSRARELAEINGRPPGQLLDSDVEQARRELMRPADQAPRSERIPEDKRWDPVPGSEPHQAPTVPAPDEQTFAEKLVQEGVQDAEHERMIQATRESLKRDKDQEG